MCAVGEKNLERLEINALRSHVPGSAVYKNNEKAGNENKRLGSFKDGRVLIISIIWLLKG